MNLAYFGFRIHFICLIILKGYGYFQVDGNFFEIKEGSVIRISPAGIRGIRNDSDETMIYMVVQSKENSLEETVEAALKQIDEKNYDAELIKRGVKEENIYHYGFAFKGKNVLIG